MNTDLYMISTWAKFSEMCREAAWNWNICGYTSTDLTSEDILHDYPVDTFMSCKPDDKDVRDDERVFTAADVADWTIAYMREMETGRFILRGVD